MSQHENFGKIETETVGETVPIESVPVHTETITIEDSPIEDIPNENSTSEIVPIENIPNYGTNQLPQFGKVPPFRTNVVQNPGSRPVPKSIFNSVPKSVPNSVPTAGPNLPNPVPIQRIELPKVIEIPFEKVVESSGNNSIEEYAGMLERNLDCMKKWSDADLAPLFRCDGSLNGLRKADRAFRVQMIRITREYTITALMLIFEEAKRQDPELAIPTRPECTSMAKSLISKENIKNKFEQSVMTCYFYPSTSSTHYGYELQTTFRLGYFHVSFKQPSHPTEMKTDAPIF